VITAANAQRSTLNAQHSMAKGWIVLSERDVSNIAEGDEPWSLGYSPVSLEFSDCVERTQQF
jgi:hypothetical protein